ncbi:phage terminase large subunit family protein [Labrenzia suaedae]|uniref:Phage terminase large subunit family protein n=1 Tax=Roseibium litorale TaxID=2803841 RepID=A0ABR9CT11_9HYPH|nr:phage terminase large subunit family protein [Roseibium litorale]
MNDNGSIVPWRNSVTPYMVEPMDVSTSRRFRACVFAGPARTGKTDALILNKTGHTISCDPQDVRIVHMSIDAAKEFARKKLAALIRYSPEVAARLGKDRYDDNTLTKNFEGNMSVDVAWPVPAKMSASDIPLMLLTDYDRMPEDIGGEGTPFDLSFKRTQTFGSRGMTIAESSPGRIVLDDDFEAPENQPHLAPPCTGILAIYNRGTRGRFYWPCPDCSESFEPDFRLLQYPEEGTPAEKGQAAFMACPHCGCILEHRHKRERNQLARWMHEGKGGQLVSIHDEALRETDIASWWLNGTVAAFQSWAELVTRYEGALEEFVSTGDSKALKTTVTVDQGKPFSERITADDDELSVKELRDRAEKYQLNIAPAETRFLIVAVDVQKGRFVVQVFAFGVELEHWVIARMDIHTPPETAPRAKDRAIDPARYPEDWDVLFDLLEREFPVLGLAFSLVPVALVVDSAGEDGVTKNAYAFYRRSKIKGYRGRVFISKGMTRWDRDRAVLRTPEKQEGKRLKQASDLKILQIGTWRLKSELVAALSRTDPGPGACHLSKNLPSEVFEELCAEEKTAKGWALKKGKKRNEAFDLGVYALALVIVLKGERINWNRPPAWAAELEKNAFARVRPMASDHEEATGDGGTAEVETEAETATPESPKPERQVRPNRKKRSRSRHRRGLGDY